MNSDNQQTPVLLKKELENDCLTLLDESTGNWLTSKLAASPEAPSFYLTFGLIGKKIANIPAQIGQKTEALFKAINPDFSADQFRLDELCRLLLLLHLDSDRNHELISTLIGSSDRKEQITIFKSLQYLENAGDFTMEMIDGLRTNMVDVFDAISQYNSFPVRFFHSGAWNQMVLKSIFMERPIYKIQGVDAKRNQKLADTLHDFVHERWSAGRNVHPELWRLVCGFENEHLIADMISLSEKGTELEKTAVRRALFDSELLEAKNWCQKNAALKPAENWNEIGKMLETAQLQKVQ